MKQNFGFKSLRFIIIIFFFANEFWTDISYKMSNDFMPQGTSSKCFGSSKTSRISLVDLAGLDRNKVDDAGGQSLREIKNIKKSLLHLGYNFMAL